MPKCELLENIHLHNQGLNCGANVCESEDYVGEKRWSSNWLTKLEPIKKNLVNFPSFLLKST